MVKSLLGQLPSIVAAGERKAEHILQQPEGRDQVSLQTREPAIPAKGRAGLNLWGILFVDTIVEDRKKNSRASEFLDHAHPGRTSTARQENVL